MSNNKPISISEILKQGVSNTLRNKVAGEINTKISNIEEYRINFPIVRDIVLMSESMKEVHEKLTEKKLMSFYETLCPMFLSELAIDENTVHEPTFDVSLTLDIDTVLDVISEHARGISCKDLADKFGVPPEEMKKRYLQPLINNNKVEPLGNKRGRVYAFKCDSD